MKFIMFIGFFVFCFFWWGLNHFGDSHPVLGVISCVLGYFIWSFVIFLFVLKDKWVLRNLVLFAAWGVWFCGGLFQDYLGLSLVISFILYIYYFHLGGRTLVNTPQKENEFWNKQDNEIDHNVKEITKGNIAQGKNVPTRIQDLPNFPCSDYQELQESLTSGRFILWKPSGRYNGQLFFLLAYPVEKFTSYVKTIIEFFGSTILAIVLSVCYSWWFLLVILSFPLFFFGTIPFGKKLYNGVIFRSATKSEHLFCLLYYLNEIELTTANRDKFWSWLKREST